MNKNAILKLDNFINDYYAEHKNSGVIRVTLKDKILYKKNVGYADIESKKEFDSNSMFTFYSLSKPFCAIGLMLLKDKGLISLDEHPSKYLPETKVFDSKLTIRHLLQHVSGLPDFVQTAKFNEKYKTGYYSQIREHLKELTSYSMVFEPGTKNMYANVNYILCALIIENVTGLKYSDYMKKEVFEPLGMNTATIDSESLVVDNRVTGYELNDGVVTKTDRDLNWLVGAGDIIGTIDDLYALNKAIKHKKLLTEDSWCEVLTPLPLNNRGFGCTITDWHGKKRITHTGGSRGFRNLHIQLIEDDFDIIFLSNSGWGNARNDLSEAIYEAFYGKNDENSQEVEMDKGYI